MQDTPKRNDDEYVREGGPRRPDPRAGRERRYGSAAEVVLDAVAAARPGAAAQGQEDWLKAEIKKGIDLRRPRRADPGRGGVRSARGQISRMAESSRTLNEGSADSRSPADRRDRRQDCRAQCVTHCDLCAGASAPRARIGESRMQGRRDPVGRRGSHRRHGKYVIVYRGAMRPCTSCASCTVRRSRHAVRSRAVPDVRAGYRHLASG